MIHAPNADQKVKDALIKALDANPKTHITAANIVSSQKVDPTIANGLKKSALLTVIFAIIIISAYILIRFRKWQFSLGAMVATAHDALMVLSFFSLFKDVLPFSLDIDQSFIAAILTVIGYSINDTVVVFDRIREFLGLHHAKTDDPKVVINDAINNTLSRTIITALTVVLILLGVIYFRWSCYTWFLIRIIDRCMLRYILVNLRCNSGYHRLWKKRSQIKNNKIYFKGSKEHLGPFLFTKCYDPELLKKLI